MWLQFIYSQTLYDYYQNDQICCIKDQSLPCFLVAGFNSMDVETQVLRDMGFLQTYSYHVKSLQVYLLYDLLLNFESVKPASFYGHILAPFSVSRIL